MMYIHNSASLRGVCTSYITQLRFVAELYLILPIFRFFELLVGYDL